MWAVVSQRSGFRSRLWDIECGACLRVLEGHEELVRCIRFDNKRIVSGAYDGCVFQMFTCTALTISRGKKGCTLSGCSVPGPVLGTFRVMDGTCYYITRSREAIQSRRVSCLAPYPTAAEPL